MLVDHARPKLGRFRHRGVLLDVSFLPAPDPARPVEVPDDALMALSLDGSPPPSGLIRYAAPFGI